MDIEQLSTMTETELNDKANAHLEHLDNENESEMTKEHHVSQAQFYLAELDRRKQAKERIENEKIANRDYKLELWVIGLIGAEIVLSVVGIVFGWIEGAKQTAVLDKLNKSSAETAATLTAVRQAQEAALETQRHTLENIAAMNVAQQNESDLSLLDMLQASGSDSRGHVLLSNRGKVSLFIWGTKFDNQQSVMLRRAAIVPFGGSYTLDVSGSAKKLLGARGDEPLRSIPFEMYLTANGKKYVGQSSVQIARVNNNLSIYCGAISITPKQW